MLFVLALACGLTTALALFALTHRRPALADRFARYAGEGAVAAPAGESLAAPIARLVERLVPPTWLTSVRAALRNAGMAGPAAYQRFLAAALATALLAVVAAAAAVAIFGLPPAVAAGVLALAASPFGLLVVMARKRREAITRELPDTIDQVCACVEAGLGLDAALGYVVRRGAAAPRAVDQEFNRYLQDLQLGLPRQEAMRQLASRAGVDDLRTLVTALAQGDALGVGVSQALKAQAQHLRIKRRQRAEERAMKAPVQILFPLALCIFPAIFVVIMGPAALQIIDGFMGRV